MKYISQTAIITLLIFSCFIYDETFGENKAEKLSPGYTPPFEYYAKPQLEKHDKDIGALNKDTAAIKGELNSLKNTIAALNKQSSEGNLKDSLDKLARDVSSLKSEIAALRTEAGLAKQAPSSVTASDITSDIKPKLSSIEHDITGLKDEITYINEKLKLMEEGK
jgi:peptidoglycan hydrolase CwlO-like protein